MPSNHCYFGEHPGLKQILIVEVWFDLRKGGRICLPRITQPEKQ
jgi:hypothetical protein